MPVFTVAAMGCREETKPPPRATPRPRTSCSRTRARRQQRGKRRAVADFPKRGRLADAGIGVACRARSAARRGRARRGGDALGVALVLLVLAVDPRLRSFFVRGAAGRAVRAVHGRSRDALTVALGAAVAPRHRVLDGQAVAR